MSDGAALPAEQTGQPFCYLTTKGRVTGRPHEIEIWFAADPARPAIYLLSGGGDRADWVRNLRRDPAVRVRIGPVTYAGTARELTGEPDELRARRLVAAKYYGWREGPLPNRWAEEALSVAIVLGASETTP